MRADNKAGSTSGRHRPLPSAADSKGISDSLPRYASPSCSSHYRVHERVVPGRPLASDVPGVLQVHLYPTHHLLAEVVRQFHVTTLKHPLHRRPFAYRIFQGLPQQFAAAREVRLPEHLQTLLYPPHYVRHVPPA